MEPDFTGWATKNDLECSDGLTIRKDAFKHQDQMQVPLVWQHQHGQPENVLGHAILENREDGVYTKAFFNDTPSGKMAKQMVMHGDVNALSIYAGKLKKKAKDVMHGMIQEVSLVLSGANPGALIDWVALRHADGTYEEFEDEAVIYTGLTLEHANNEGDNMAQKTDADEETVADVLESMSDKQRNVLDYLVGEALASGKGDIKHSDLEEDEDEDDKSEEDDADKSEEDDADDSDEDENDEDDDNDDLEHANKEGADVSRNVFEKNGEKAQERKGATLSHSQLETIMTEAKQNGSLKDAFLAHATEYGIENIDYLFPDPKNLTNAPEFVSRQMEWVKKVIDGVKKSPFSRIKTMSADITAEAARAKGYVKGNYKKEEWFTLAKRVTTPATIYKKQKLDRDDIIDITDLDVVAWIKAEMRVMLNEEIARAILIGDGREIDDEDKVDENCIRPIAREPEFYAHKVTVATSASSKTMIEAIIRSRTKYRGSGSITAFMHEDLLTDLLLETDKLGRELYPTIDSLARKLRVKEIVPVEVMEGITTDEGDLLAILVDLNDYTMGADRGGAISMFDDFDIDYNQYKYLLETRFSGALTKFKSAIIVTRTGGTLIDTTSLEPSFSDPDITIPSVTGVTYYQVVVGGPNTVVTGTVTVPAGEMVEIEAVADEGYAFPHNTDTDWIFEASE